MVQPTHTQEQESGAYRTSAKPPPEKMYYLVTRVFFVGAQEPFEYRFKERPKSVAVGHLAQEQTAWENVLGKPGTITRAGSIINTLNVTRVEVFPREVESEDSYP